MNAVHPSPLRLPVQPLTAEAVAPYGWMLGQAPDSRHPGPVFAHPDTDFWRAHVFDPGQGGQTEILWVHYRSTDTTVATLEQHLRTEQAVVPLTGSVVQVLATSDAAGQPDLATAVAFLLPPGRGLCMRPGCWHATRVQDAQVSCLMLTRSATTLDLVAHLDHGHTLQESALCRIPVLQLEMPTA